MTDRPWQPPGENPPSGPGAEPAAERAPDHGLRAESSPTPAPELAVPASRPFEPPSTPAAVPAAGDSARPRGGWGAKILFWGGLLLMIGASLALVGDWASRNFETVRLLEAIEASEQQMARAQDQILAVDLPAEPTAEQTQQVGQELRDIAAAGRRGVAEAGLAVGRVSFLPWHADLVSAQKAYLAHNRAWEDYLASGAEEPQLLFQDDNDIEPTWRRAQFQVREAVPPLPWPGVSDRVQAIFTDEEAAVPGGDVAA